MSDMKFYIWAFVILMFLAPVLTVLYSIGERWWRRWRRRNLLPPPDKNVIKRNFEDRG